LIVFSANNQSKKSRSPQLHIRIIGVQEETVMLSILQRSSLAVLNISFGIIALQPACCFYHGAKRNRFLSTLTTIGLGILDHFLST